MKAPFPYAGGKSTVANLIWDALGDVNHYIEPFFGSGAVLLARPSRHRGRVETVCDKDGFIANVWRALQAAPDEVAKYCDRPVNHADLSARKRRMIAEEARLLENLIADENWYDAKIAGYWIWAASCWIGSGLTRPNAMPHISNGGNGVHAIGKIPHVGHGGKGVHAIGKIPHVGHGGKGVHAIGKRPESVSETKDVREPYNTNIYAWFRELSERLRAVRVVCGDWSRVCGGNWQGKMGMCGMLFDPPYGIEDRDTDLYHHDSTAVAADVSAWCLERGKDKDLRIVVAGYEEHEELLSHGWTKTTWSAGGGYANIRKDRGLENRHRECLYFSPHCLQAEQGLFAGISLSAPGGCSVDADPAGVALPIDTKNAG